MMNHTYHYIKNIEEKQFVKMVLDDTRRASQQNRVLLTDFYNKEWMESLLNQYIPQRFDVQYTFWGGYEGAERQRLCISPYEIQEKDFEIGVLRIGVKVGIGKRLSHRDYLGALLGLGIERCVIGDIILKDWGAYVITEGAMLPYLRGQLGSIGRYQKLIIEEIEPNALDIEKPQTKEVSVVVSALRADAVVAAMFGLSRSECAKLIQGDKAKRNGLSITVSTLLKEGDTITLRGYGKVRLVTVNGYTKKNRLHITLEKYV